MTLTEQFLSRRLSVLAYPRYGREAPSSRYRIEQFLPWLADQGIDVECCPLLDNWYMENLRAGERPSVIRLAGAYIKRIRRQLSSRTPDLIWIEKELLPWMPWGLERLLLSTGVPVLIDLDDCQFHRYDQHPNRLVRSLLGGKIDRGMAGAHHVTCGSSYIAERAAKAGARRITNLPTLIDLDRYPKEPASASTSPTSLVVGWIGTPGNTPYLSMVEDALSRLASEIDLRILVIGGRPGTLKGLPVEYREWSEATEIADLQQIDVGIMPIPDRPFERGKCGLKLLQYMASWKPSIASPVGTNAALVTPGLNGYLANNSEEWLQAFRDLYSDPSRRKEMGRAGRALVERDYSLSQMAPELANLMRLTAQKSLSRDRSASIASETDLAASQQGQA